MKALGTICLLLLAALLITVDQVNAQSVWVLEEIYVADSSIYCGEGDMPTYLNPDEPGPKELTRKCLFTEPGITGGVDLKLIFNYPTQLTYQNPGTFTADASLELSHQNDNSESTASIDLEIEGDMWHPSPDCQKEEYEVIDLPRGIPVNTTLTVAATCDYLGACNPCDYYDAWWSGDEAAFKFDVRGYAGGGHPSFYLWLTYKEQPLIGPFTLNVNKRGSCSGTVISRAHGINCGNECGQLYPPGTVVTLSAIPDSTCYRYSWSRSDGGHCDDNEDCAVIMDQDITISANFEKPRLLIDGQGTGGGIVKSKPPGIDCETKWLIPRVGCSANFDFGTTVELTAETDFRSIFQGWSGGGCSGTKKCIVTMKEHLTIKPIFLNKPIAPILGPLLFYND